MADKPNNLTPTEAVIQALQELLDLDPKACRALVDSRVDANEELVKSGLNLLQGNKKKQIGIMGVINSALEKMGQDRVGLLSDNDECVAFMRVPKK